MVADNEENIASDTARLAALLTDSAAGLSGNTWESTSDLVVCWADIKLPLLNAILMPPGARDAESVRRSLAAGRDFMLERSRPGTLLTPISRLRMAAGRKDLSDFLLSQGLVESGRMSAMYGRVSNLPPSPHTNLTFKRVKTLADIELTADINCKAHAWPTSWFKTAVAVLGRRASADTVAIVAFMQDEPVATASVKAFEGSLSAGFVATYPFAQRHGYATATLQHALLQAARLTGLDDTDLHATVAGRPVYSRLGYAPGVDFVVLEPSA